MSEKTSWEVELDEDVSPAARKADSALARLQRRIQRFSSMGMSKAMGGLGGLRDRLNRAAIGAGSMGVAATRDRAGKLRNARGQFVNESALGNLWGKVGGARALDMVPGLAAARGRKMGPFRQGSLDERAAGFGASLGPRISAMSSGFGSAAKSAGTFFKKLDNNAVASKVFGGIKDGVMGVALAFAAAAAGLTVATIKMVDFGQKSRAAFSMMLGGEDEGARAFDQSRKLAVALGMQIEDVAGSYQRFLSMGFDQAESQELIKMGADMTALGNSTEKVRSVLDAMGKINATGTMQGDELMMLAEAGINIGSIYDKLGEKFGKTRAEIVKMKEAGKVSSRDAIDAIKATVLATTGQTEFGAARQNVIANTLGGGWDQLKAQVRDKMIDVADLAEKPLVKMLAAIRKSMSGALGGNAGSTAVSGIGRMVEWVAEKVEAAMPAIETFVGAFYEGMSSVLGPMSEIADGMSSSFGGDRTELIKKMGEALGQLAAVALSAGVVFGGTVLSALVSVCEAINAIVAASKYLTDGLGSFIFSFTDGAANQEARRRAGAEGNTFDRQGIANAVNGVAPGSANNTTTATLNTTVNAVVQPGATKAEGEAFGKGAAQGFDRQAMGYFNGLNDAQGT